ncbi:MAG: hypothetical protein MRY78_13095 [Saprospiraceae bacterium]|nr:hypothetical protein [Saprospiraceae bacterium]
MPNKLSLLLFFCCSVSMSFAQIYLTNASFEGEPEDAKVPVGWFACELGTTPDILPGEWGVYKESSEGETYVGLITREDGTWESIGQRLLKPLKPKNCYTMSMDLAHSDTYSAYNQPIRLRVWGGLRKCGRDQLLFESDIIKHTDWKKYEFQFNAKNFINYIIVEAYYKNGPFSHKGNVLVDNISPIKDCIRASLD